MELSGNYTFSNWKVRRGPEGLSVNDQNSVIVVCANDGKIEICTADGIKLHEIVLKSDAFGTLFSCQTKVLLSLVTANLQNIAVLHSYGALHESQLMQMNTPTALSSDQHGQYLSQVI